jgi:hypothetical protein
MNNNRNNIITTITNNQINNRRNEIRNPFQPIETDRWLNNYRLEVNTNIPVINRVRGMEVLDSGGIRVLNQNPTLTNNFIDSVQNNTNQLIVNQDTSLLSNEFIENSQQIINNNLELSAPLMSVFLNNPELNNLLINLRNNLSNFNGRDYDELIKPFMNSFMVFLSINSGIDTLTLNDFYRSLRELELGLNTLISNQENLNIMGRINQENSINLEGYVNTVRSILERFNTSTNNSLQELLNTSSVRQEEQVLQSLTQNVEIIERSQVESESIALNSNGEVEKNKEETIKKLKKLFLNKKILALFLSSLCISQIGVTLPWDIILRQLNLESSSQTVPVLNPSSQPNDIVRIRDIWDLILKNLKDYLDK